jgi:hypothetical protein
MAAGRGFPGLLVLSVRQNRRSLCKPPRLRHSARNGEISAFSPSSPVASLAVTSPGASVKRRWSRCAGREHGRRLDSNGAVLPPAAPRLLDGEQPRRRASLEGGILSVLEVLVEACAGYLTIFTPLSGRQPDWPHYGRHRPAPAGGMAADRAAPASTGGMAMQSGVAHGADVLRRTGQHALARLCRPGHVHEHFFRKAI